MRQLIKKQMKNEKGLTLIELLAVIVILGIIAAIAIPSISGIIQNSKEDAVKADAITILNAAKNYVAANGVPEDETITATDLSTYVSGIGEKFGEYTVTTSDGVEFVLNTPDPVVAGNKSIKFDGASITDINDDADTLEVTDN